SRSSRYAFHAATIRSTSSASLIRPSSRTRRAPAVEGHRCGRGRLVRRSWCLSGRGPPWCNGSTTAFGAVRSRFESWRRSMTENNLAIVVLAAGQGTRMKSRLPKVLHEIGGRPLVGHVLSTARALGAQHIEVVVRHEREQVVATLTEQYPDAVIVDQDEIPGTGRAVQVALDALPADFDGDVLVLSGDVPLLEAETLEALIARHRAASAAATLLSAHLDDPT